MQGTDAVIECTLHVRDNPVLEGTPINGAAISDARISIVINKLGLFVRRQLFFHIFGNHAQGRTRSRVGKHFNARLLTYFSGAMHHDRAVKIIAAEMSVTRSCDDPEDIVVQLKHRNVEGSAT